jgi:hypothetical protein
MLLVLNKRKDLSLREKGLLVALLLAGGESRT